MRSDLEHTRVPLGIEAEDNPYWHLTGIELERRARAEAARAFANVLIRFFAWMSRLPTRVAGTARTRIVAQP